jgi:predicted XRE-type DNA-binding protein
MKKTLNHQMGSGNVFEDLGFENPEEQQHKAQIASLIYNIIEGRKLNQKEAGKILGVNQPKVSALKNGRLEGFSIERLFKYLALLGQDIHVVVKPKTGSKSRFAVSTSPDLVSATVAQ